jgi:amino acid transporter
MDQIHQQLTDDDLQFTVFVDTSSSAIRNFLFLMILMSFLAEVLALTLICLILLMLRRNSKKYSRNTYRLHVQLTLVLLAQVRVWICVYI